MFIRLLEKSTGATKDNRRIIETVTHLQNLYATRTSKDQQETLTQALESSTLALPSEKGEICCRNPTYNECILYSEYHY